MVVSVSGRRLVASMTASVFLLMPLSAFAVTAGPNNAGSGAEAAGPGTVAWSNEGNITVDDTNYATSNMGPGETSEYLVASNFGFAIPSNATIDGITVTIARASSANTLGFSINDSEVRLMKNGVIGGDNNATATDWPTSIGTATYGGSTDDWGQVWTPADINSSNFGVALSAFAQTILSNRTASVDYIRVSVDYSLGAILTPATGGSAIPNNTAGGTYTTLTGPVLAEAVTDNIGNGTIILNAPAGFQFDASSNVTVLVTRTGGAGADNLNINGLPSGGTINATETASTITITISDDTDGSVTNSLTWQGIKVRPTAALPLASGNITNGGTSIIDAVSAGSNFGSLASIASVTTSTTALVSSANPSVYGDNVTFTATVTGSTPTGTVQFKNGVANLGAPVALVAGVATYATSALSAATHSITAEYAGDMNNTASVSPAVSQLVNKKNLVIAAMDQSRNYGDANPVFTYSVTGFVNGEVLGTSDVMGAPMLSTAAGVTTDVGTGAIAVALGTLSSNNYGFTLTPGVLTITQRTLTVAATASDKAYDGTTTASVTLSDDRVGGDDVTLGYASADFDTATVGTNKTVTVTGMSITGGADMNNYVLGNASDTDTADITQAATSTSTVIDTPTPNSIVGENVQFDATVTGVNVTGTVEFREGATVLGTGAVVMGAATFTTNALSVGNHSINAYYLGDTNNQPSNSPVIIVHVIDKDSPDTVTTISSSGSSLVGASVDFTATVAGAFNPTGTVEFYDGVVLIGTGSLNGSFQATLNHAFTLAGNHDISAHYLGDGNNNASVSGVEVVIVQEVRKDTPVTATVLSVANPSIIGDTVVMTADVTGGYGPAGVVFFKDGGMFIGSGALVAGTATFSTDQLAVGSHDLTAEYQGDVNNNASTSAIVTVQVVQQMTSVTILGNIPTPVQAPASVTFQVTVNGFFPTGTVTIHDGPSAILNITLSNGSGSFTQVFTGEQTSHIFKAEYLGDVNNTSSMSPETTVFVAAPSEQVAGTQNAGAGSNRGNNTQRAANITQFLANLHLGDLAPGAFGGADAPLAGAEKEFICSIQRSLPSLYTSAYLKSLAQVVSAYTGRTAEVIADWLRDESVCADITQARLGVERVAQADLTSFYVSSEGTPLSSNPTWNKCVTGKFTYEDIQANLDRNRKGTPKSCADYHTGSNWYHPDFRMFFDWNVATKKLTLPSGYVIKKNEAVSAR